MPMMQTVLGKLNTNMSHGNIRAFAKDHAAKYAHGKPLHEALADAGADPGELHDKFQAHLQNMPGAIAEALRATIHYALTTKTMVTFAWAPSYDFELDIWQAPDTKATKGGITVLFKSRYPDHPHPLAGS